MWEHKLWFALEGRVDPVWVEHFDIDNVDKHMQYVSFDTGVC